MGRRSKERKLRVNDKVFRRNLDLLVNNSRRMRAKRRGEEGREWVAEGKRRRYVKMISVRS